MQELRNRFCDKIIECKLRLQGLNDAPIPMPKHLPPGLSGFSVLDKNVCIYKCGRIHLFMHVLLCSMGGISGYNACNEIARLRILLVPMRPLTLMFF